MEQNISQAEAEYFGLAEKWDEELYGKLKRDRLIAFVIAGISAFLTALAIIAVMLLTPLKTVEPYMVLVDKTTGYSEAIRPLKHEGTSLTERESIVLSEINSYMLARNTFDSFDLDRRYNIIRTSTSSSEFNRYLAELRRDTERYTAGTRRLVTIKSIVPDMFNKTAQIRFSTSIESGSQQHWIATINFTFVNLNLSVKDRYLNPLGFLVTGYRVDPETVQ